MSLTSQQRSGLVLLSGMLLAMALGSLHAFSVFLEPLEARFQVSRVLASLTYSLALVSLTLGVLFGHLVFARLRPAGLVGVICLAAAGCALASMANQLAILWLGYGLLFGTANGLGYACALQVSAQANGRRKGLAMGLVTACYALGAAVAPAPLALLLQDSGLSGAMAGLALCFVAIAPVTAGLMLLARAELRVSAGTDETRHATARRQTVILWFGYGTAVAAGLMAIGHATGIARAAGLAGAAVLAAPILIAVFNMLGSLAGGRLADRVAVRRALLLFPALSALALVMLALLVDGPAVLIGLAIIGFAYGASITVYPAAISRLFGAAAGVRLYGQVFTAWGLAGLLAPWFAGLLYGRFGDYRLALLTAGCCALLSVLTVRALPSDAGGEQARGLAGSGD